MRRGRAPSTATKKKTRNNAIKGLGIDIVEISRIEQAIKEREEFIHRLFTPLEQRYCNEHVHRATRYAGRFAAKEAIAKLFGGFGDHLAFLDIEILPSVTGAPIPTFSERVQVHFLRPKVLLSISHCKTYATAVAAWYD